MKLMGSYSGIHEVGPDCNIWTASGPLFGAFLWQMAWEKIEQRYIT